MCVAVAVLGCLLLLDVCCRCVRRVCCFRCVRRTWWLNCVCCFRCVRHVCYCKGVRHVCFCRCVRHVCYCMCVRHVCCCRCAPEALCHRRFSRESDVWSYGITLWEVYSFGTTPSLCKFDIIVPVLHDGQRLPRPEGCPPDVYQLMLKCWEYYPLSRIHFDSILDAIVGLKSNLPI